MLLPATVHLTTTIHPSSNVHLLLTLWCFCYIFGFLPILSLLILYDFGFLYFSLVMSIYKPQYVSITNQSIKLTGEAFSSPAFLNFSPFSLIFLALLGSQTPSEDDNSEDEWLKPFLLEAEGCWVQDLEVT